MNHLSRRAKLAVFMALILAISSFGVASAQNPAYQTNFTTSITYQNVGTGDAQVVFQFYNEAQSTSKDITRTLKKGAGDSMFLGSLTGSEALPANFLGSAVLSSDQPIVATLVQIPQNSTNVKNRPLSNGFKDAAPKILFATVLKNQFSTTSSFSVQNASQGAVDLTVSIFNADTPSDPPIVIAQNNLPAGAAKYFDMGKLTQITAASFNGSATAEAKVAGQATAANIVGSVTELSTNGVKASAFEAVTGGAVKVFMPSALCQTFAEQYNTAYAVQNNDPSNAANVTVTYSNGATQGATIQPGTKASFQTCDATNFPKGQSLAAVITSDREIVVIGKAIASNYFQTAFLGEATGNPKLALPYVRWTSQANFDGGTRQRTFIAIQNVGAAPVNNVQVQYLNNEGTVIGTHTIASIAAGAKANSNASMTDNKDTPAMIEFGNPASNPNNAFGGAVVIQGPAGSELIAVARVQTKTGATTVGEDYNGIAIQ